MPYIVKDDRDGSYLYAAMNRNSHHGWHMDRQKAIRYPTATEAEGMRHAAACWLACALADFSLEVA